MPNSDGPRKKRGPSATRLESSSTTTTRRTNVSLTTVETQNELTLGSIDSHGGGA